MLILLASIGCSVAVSVLLKVARRYAIQIQHAIAINYLVAATLCFALLRPQPALLLSPGTPWWVLIALGVLLPSVFLVMAAAVRHAGIVVSDAAQRLSLLIPLTAAFIVFGEQTTPARLAGIGVALVALICLLAKPRSNPRQSDELAGHPPSTTVPTSSGRLAPILLLAVWLGYGVIDVLFKIMAASATEFANSLLVSFLLSALLLGGYLLIRKSEWTARSIMAGIVLGLLNFGNIYFYIRAHQIYPDNPTLVFTSMNIGVIALGLVIGAGLFRERLSWINGLGLAMAVLAIATLLPA